jgi:hypothetical protein
VDVPLQLCGSTYVQLDGPPVPAKARHLAEAPMPHLSLAAAPASVPRLPTRAGSDAHGSQLVHLRTVILRI